jgi:hypothetical protein
MIKKFHRFCPQEPVSTWRDMAMYLCPPKYLCQHGEIWQCISVLWFFFLLCRECFVNYKKSALDSQLQVIKFTSCLPMVGGSLRLLPSLKLVAMTNTQYARYNINTGFVCLSETCLHVILLFLSIG